MSKEAIKALSDEIVRWRVEFEEGTTSTWQVLRRDGKAFDVIGAYTSEDAAYAGMAEEIAKYLMAEILPPFLK